MDSNLTEIVVVLDRSGSMASMKTEAEGGLAAFVADQKGQPGAARLTLAIFDHEYDLIHDRADLREVPGRFALEPRGMTALLDAVGRTIDAVGRALADTPEPDRPGCSVLFCVITDGGENASREYAGDRVREDPRAVLQVVVELLPPADRPAPAGRRADHRGGGVPLLRRQEQERVPGAAMVEEQKTKYNWQFTFLGAGPEVFAQGGRIGFDAAAGGAFVNAGSALRATSAKFARMRTAAAAGADAATLAAANVMTDAERDELNQA